MGAPGCPFRLKHIVLPGSRGASTPLPSRSLPAHCDSARRTPCLAPYAAPLPDNGRSWGTPDETRPGSTAWPPAVPPFFLPRVYPTPARSSQWGALRTVLPQHRTNARTLDRTTQGGPPSGDRKYGTGGGLVILGGERRRSQRIGLRTGRYRQGTIAGRRRGVARPDASGDPPGGEAM